MGYSALLRIRNSLLLGQTKPTKKTFEVSKNHFCGILHFIDHRPGQTMGDFCLGRKFFLPHDFSSFMCCLGRRFFFSQVFLYLLHHSSTTSVRCQKLAVFLRKQETGDSITASDQKTPEFMVIIQN
ncbi:MULTISPECIES: hypothetical protein [Moorena]|nr:MULTISPECIES: hypothetical protein [Moorena]NEP30240.1 hypothetical protein [Moorena sp. SIO3B2]NER88387.1 hypothetical protein [Moorena sp. SIO3A2]